MVEVNGTTPGRGDLLRSLFISAGLIFPLTSPLNHGGGERDRTDDLLRARQALSQLSYTPKNV